MSTDFQPGDVVRLKSGGPSMTVLRGRDETLTDPRQIKCGWMHDSGEPRSAHWPEAALKLLSGSGRSPYPGLDRSKLPEDIIDRVSAVSRALSAYVATVAHMQRTVNDEEWATHGDWGTLEARATEALNRLRMDEWV